MNKGTSWQKLFETKTGYALGSPKPTEEALDAETFHNPDFKYLGNVEIYNRDGTLFIGFGRTV